LLSIEVCEPVTSNWKPPSPSVSAGGEQVRGEHDAELRRERAELEVLAAAALDRAAGPGDLGREPRQHEVVRIRRGDPRYADERALEPPLDFAVTEADILDAATARNVQIGTLDDVRVAARGGAQ
jgi:hypothetical protein